MIDKVCRGCGVKLTDSNIYPSLVKKQSWVCKPCHSKATMEWGKKNPGKVSNHRRKTKLKGKYGISLEEYEALYRKQLSFCAICLEHHARRPLNVDHCHKTGRVRGLLCDRCNLAIGLFRDDMVTISRIVRYLR